MAIHLLYMTTMCLVHVSSDGLVNTESKGAIISTRRGGGVHLFVRWGQFWGCLRGGNFLGSKSGPEYFLGQRIFLGKSKEEGQNLFEPEPSEGGNKFLCALMGMGGTNL